MKKCLGFTLIELAIVMVIIGLVVGGVVVGREMIHTANIRKTAKMLTDLDLALSTFRLKYGCEAGDCVASRFGLGSGMDGNGNGSVMPTHEWYNSTLPQLYAAGLISYEISGSIRVPVGQNAILTLGAYQSPSASDYYYGAILGSLTSPTGLVAFEGAQYVALSPNDALRLDIMLDDGQPNGGRMLATGDINKFIMVGIDGGSSGAEYDGSTSAGPVNDGVSCTTNATPAAYNNMSSDNPLCALVYTFGSSKQ